MNWGNSLSEESVGLRGTARGIIVVRSITGVRFGVRVARGTSFVKLITADRFGVLLAIGLAVVRLTRRFLADSLGDAFFLEGLVGVMSITSSSATLTVAGVVDFRGGVVTT